LGHGNEEAVTPPQPIAALAGVKAVQVACGSSHSLVLGQDGTLYTFGRNEVRRPLLLSTRIMRANHVDLWSAQDGESGHPGETNQYLPRVVESLLGESPIVAMSAAAKYERKKEGNHGKENDVTYVCGAHCRQSVVLLQDGRVLAFGEGSHAAREIKRKNWLVPRSVVAGEGAVFLVC
jgi:hypothetical protein